MSRPVSILLGIGLLVLAVFYFIRPGVAGTHLSPLASILHAIWGLLALAIGIRGSTRATRLLCAGSVLILFALGALGFALGSWQYPSPSIPGPANGFMWKMFPGSLELGTRDHILHFVLAAFFALGLLPGFPGRSRGTGTTARADAAR